MDTITMLERVLSMLIVGVTGIGLTFARRHNNEDANAGEGVAFCTLTLVILMWFLTA